MTESRTVVSWDGDGLWGGVWRDGGGVGMGREGRITNGNEEAFGPESGDGFTVICIKPIRLYTLNRCSFVYINCTSIKLFLKS